MTSRAGTGVSILEGRDTTLASPDMDNVYLNDNRAASDWIRAPTKVEVEWASDTLLIIRQSPKAHLVFAAIKFAGVTIRHDTLR